MISDDPFTHEEFRDRLGKLLRLLSSDQEAEAETARRKLVQHLSHHGVSLNDLSDHLTGPQPAPPPSWPFDTQEAAPAAQSEMLRHAAARAQRSEAAHRAAEEMNERLLSALEAARGRVRTAWMAAGVLGGTLVLAGVAALVTSVWHRPEPAATVQQIAPRMSDAVAAAPADTSAGARHPGEWIGTVLQPAELLDDPDSAAQRRAMLEVGTRVLVLQSGPAWLRVRTERGDGFILKGLVRADR